MRIIEFVGCPGVGKSSICQKVMEQLDSEGYSVLNIDHSVTRAGRLTRLFLRAGVMLSGSTRELKYVLENYLATFPGYFPENHFPGIIMRAKVREGESPQDKVNRLRRRWGKTILRAAYKIGTYPVKQLDYAFFDEGTIQYLTAITHDVPFTDDVLPVISKLNDIIYSQDVAVIHVKAEKEENVRRIRTRARKGDRFFTEDDNEALRLLEMKERNIDFVLSRLKISNLSYIENMDLNEAVEKVLDKIHEWATL